MRETFRAIREWKWLLVGAAALVLGTLAVNAQNPNASQTPAPQTQRAAVPAPSPTPTPINWSDDPMLKRLVFRGIGPASMGGRIDDIAAVEGNPYIYYVGLATGGVYKTTNNGTTFTPIFDTYSTASTGDIAIAPSNPDIVWVGTGEANNRQSSSFGDGIYKSTDAGKTFTKMGLENSQTIARIVIDPKDPNVVYVAVLGHLFGPNKERGIYKTSDGGKTWSQSKFIDEDTGFTDLVMDRSDSKTLYAASYQRRRTSWGFNGGGPGSGIWKTIDAGKTWIKLQGNGYGYKRAFTVSPSEETIARLHRLAALRARGFDLAVVDVSATARTPAGPGDVGELAHRLWHARHATLQARYRALGVPVVEWDGLQALDGALAELREARRSARTVRR